MQTGAQGAWRPLFDGISFNGWMPKSAEHGWEISDGALHLARPMGGAGRRDLYTVEMFDNFELDLEYRIAPGTNSGIFFRVADINDPVDWRFTGFEVQILDPDRQDQFPPYEQCGAIYGLVAPSLQVSKPAGEWNQVRILCDGPHVFVALNGRIVSSLDARLYKEPYRNLEGKPTKFHHAYASLPWRGHIALQDHGGEVWYRSIRIRMIA